MADYVVTLVVAGFVGAIIGPPMGRHERRVVWRRSAHDERRHAFHELGELFSEALCEHSAPNTHLADEPAAALCVVCVLVHGADLTDNDGDRGQWR